MRLVGTMARPNYLVTSLVLVALAVGCSDDGRTLAPAQPDQTQSVIDPTTTLAPDPQATPSTLTATVGWTVAGQPDALDVAYSCDGAGTSPEVRWEAVPAAAVEIAVAVVDLDAQGYVHWVLAGLDPLGFVPAGQLPPDAIVLASDAGTDGWSPPCPPEGAAHRYQLTVYAMATPGLGEATNASEAIEYLDGAAISTADVVVRYSR